LNYFTHAVRFLTTPEFVAGLAAPDWLGAVDRKVRMRQPGLEREKARCKSVDDRRGIDFCNGVLQHLSDDDWFHRSRGFVEVVADVTRFTRANLPENADFAAELFAHILVELLLDAVLISRLPERLDQYYQLLEGVDLAKVQGWISRVSQYPTDRLTWFVPLFVRERFLQDYSDDDRLAVRLQQIWQRIRLGAMQKAFVLKIVPWSRSLITARLLDLLPPDQFSIPSGPS
jgi:hypothetical protein